MNPPSVSVVVRTCNRPGAVYQAVQSVLDQTWDPLEVVVVNDGACRPDLPPAPKRPVRVIEPKNRFNRSRAANTGWQTATGKLVAFLDDDDLLAPNHIQTLVQAMAEAPWCSIAYTGAVQEDENKRRTCLPCREFDLAALLRENLFPIHAALVRKDVLAAVGGFDESLGLFEDWDLWLRLGLEGYGFLRVNAWTAIYRCHGQGTLAQIRFGTATDLSARWKIIRKHEHAIQMRLAGAGPSGRARLMVRKLLFKVAKDWLT